MQIVLNAGGHGTRLWPISTKQIPKQFSPIIGSKTMLEDTYLRVLESFGKKNIWVSTNEKYLSKAKEILPDLDPSHFLTEPQRRDTFPAVAAHSAVIAGLTSVDEPIVFLSSDAYITPKSSIVNHNKSLKIIQENLINKDFDILVVGIKPNQPSTRFGYIQINENDAEECYSTAVKVNSFREKPSLETAEKYIKDGNYLWNLGAFAFKYKNILKILDLLEKSEIVNYLESIRKDKFISLENFQKLPQNSFDYAILEHFELFKLGMVGMKLQVWDDIGSYDTLYNYLPHIQNLKEKETEKSLTNSNHIQIDGSGNKVQTYNPERKVAFVGTSNLIVVESEEGLLVIDPRNARSVKEVAGYFED